MVEGIFFLRVSARETREELVYFSPICMTYNNEKKKRYFTYIDDKKKKKRETSYAHQPPYLMMNMYTYDKKKSAKKLNHA
jgi:hypothetical protein